MGMEVLVLALKDRLVEAMVLVVCPPEGHCVAGLDMVNLTRQMYICMVHTCTVLMLVGPITGELVSVSVSVVLNMIVRRLQGGTSGAQCIGRSLGFKPVLDEEYIYCSDHNTNGVHIFTVYDSLFFASH